MRTLLASSRDYHFPRYGSLGCLQNTAFPKREMPDVTERKLTTCFHGVMHNLSVCLEKDCVNCVNSSSTLLELLTDYELSIPNWTRLSKIS